jgi:hypothetical protein
MSHSLQCRCGTLRGELDHPERCAHAICYCKDCQAFAHFLGKADEILDDAGGTEVIAARPAYLRFTAGMDKLTCMRLTEKGLLRWYASCCNTPIGNTPPDFRTPFVGLVRDCLDRSDRSIDEAVGPVRMWIMTASAKRKVEGHVPRTIVTMLGFMLPALMGRFTGGYKRTPFFSHDGVPVRTPSVLPREEHDRLKASL